jgi:hypothetical protein
MYEGWKKRYALSSEWVSKTDSPMLLLGQRPEPMLGALVASVGTFISLSGGVCR